MREIDPELQARLDSGATTLCRCWRVRRADGREYGFCDHDDDLVFDATTFRASTGLDASAVQATTGLAVDNAQVMGALSDVGVSDKDIRAGRFDRARIEHWLVDWSKPELRVLMFVGTFGEIRQKNGAFEVELRGLTEALNLAVGRTLLRRCDRRLGDERCRFDLATPGVSVDAEIVDALSDVMLTATGFGAQPAGWFKGGSLTWTTGPNASEVSTVKTDHGNVGGSRRLELWRRAGSAIAAGHLFRVTAGCDKAAETCQQKFDNFLNFRGFPDIPGDDWVAAYPKNGQVHDGASRRNG